jgi:hypothetical protein
VLGEHFGAAVVLAQAEHPAAGVADQAGGLVGPLLHDRADAPALGGVAHRGALAVQGVGADRAQQGHRHAGHLADPVLGIELARGQALKAQVGLQLGVEGLVGGGWQYSSMTCAAVMGAGRLVVFHLMRTSMRRPRARACWATLARIGSPQKPPSARTSRGAAHRRCASGSGGSKS